MADWTEDEEKNLIKMFKELGAKPKSDNPEELRRRHPLHLL